MESEKLPLFGNNIDKSQVCGKIHETIVQFFFFGSFDIDVLKYIGTTNPSKKNFSVC